MEKNKYYEEGKGSLFRCFNGIEWPLPGEELSVLNWTLRYGQPTIEDMFYAASVVGAYAELIGYKKAKREMVVKELMRTP